MLFRRKKLQPKLKEKGNLSNFAHALVFQNLQLANCFFKVEEQEKIALKWTTDKSITMLKKIVWFLL